MKKRKSNPKSNWARESNKFLRSPNWRLIKSVMFDHFDKVCVNCGSDEKIHVDHVVARVHDPSGESWLDVTNLQPLCEHCNCTIKGIKNTDYRNDEFKEKIKTLVPLVEEAFELEKLSLKWTLFNGAKEARKKKKTDNLKKKIRDFVNDSTSFDEVKLKFNITKDTPNYKNILLHIKNCITNAKDAKRMALQRGESKKLERLNKEKIIEHNKLLKGNNRKRKKTLKRLKQLNGIIEAGGCLRNKELVELKDLVWKKQVLDDFYRNIK